MTELGNLKLRCLLLHSTMLATVKAVTASVFYHIVLFISIAILIVNQLCESNWS